MAVLEAALSVLSLPSPSSSSSKPYLFPQRTKPTSFSLRIPSNLSPILSLNFPLSSGGDNNTRRLVSVLCSVAEKETSAEEETSQEEKNEETQKSNLKRKLFVFNLPWSMSVHDISDLFRQCGTVNNVEIIRQKDGKNRGFAFVTMASGEEAQAAVDKFDAFEVSGRIIRVNFARRFKKPTPKPPNALPSPPAGETRHKLYISNLAWKARSTHLRELFTAADFNPVSARVVFADPEGRSSGYGFVSFVTREEAEDAITKLDGKEIMGRPIILKFSLRTASESEGGDTVEDNNTSEDSDTVEDNTSEDGDTAEDNNNTSEEKPVE
ncbi:PREDICTED: 28 kDa ribonucleoprotein, chloroplastic [Camelina sativa]|uniref:28 kDa ribonucleoprotein, chloroplastic n=1 Tax=Camelina sativa TaxID=90675 RepID=A0ABM0YS03_CAMSA|nr:PREDICTED: 28 kDa ribonucleoprotein, chloroplastic [Camelina sativa]